MGCGFSGYETAIWGIFQQYRILRRCQLLSFQPLQHFVEKSIRNSSPFETCPRDCRAVDHPPQTSEKSEVFLLSEDIIKADIYDRPLQKHKKREYIKPLYRTQTLHQTESNGSVTKHM